MSFSITSPDFEHIGCWPSLWIARLQVAWVKQLLYTGGYRTLGGRKVFQQSQYRPRTARRRSRLGAPAAINRTSLSGPGRKGLDSPVRAGWLSLSRVPCTVPVFLLPNYRALLPRLQQYVSANQLASHASLLPFKYSIQPMRRIRHNGHSPDTAHRPRLPQGTLHTAASQRHYIL